MGVFRFSEGPQSEPLVRKEVLDRVLDLSREKVSQLNQIIDIHAAEIEARKALSDENGMRLVALKKRVFDYQITVGVLVGYNILFTIIWYCTR